MNVIKAICDPMIEFANWFWGLPILILVGGGGLYMAIRMGFPQIRYFGYFISQTFGKMFSRKKAQEGTVSPFAAANTALASSIGASNIVGVPVAIAMGGPGAVFWIWILALVGMCTKYVEVVVGLHYREKNTDGEMVGGPYYIWKKGIGGKIGAAVGVIYAFMLMLEIFPSMCTQSASACSQFVVFGIDPKIIAALVTVLCIVVCIGGMKRVGDVCSMMVPAMAGVYMIGALILIIMNIGNLPGAIGLVFHDAFTGHAATGGFAGAGTAMAIRWGAARGIYSNEAGMGTAIQGHAGADVDHPVRQGFWGMFEVGVDTLLVCTVTALAILTTGVWTAPGASENTGALAQMAYASGFGTGFAHIFVAICVFFFVVSTMIVLIYFGQRQAEFLFGVKFSKAWRWVYILACVIGGLGVQLPTLYALTDFFLAWVVIPNMIGIMILTPLAIKLQKEYFNTPGKYYLADVAEKEARKAKKSA